MVQRERRGFRRLGAVDVDARAGLSRARARDLRLQRAWLRAAGPKLAVMVRAVRVLRGTLEMAVEEDGTRRELAGVLPLVAARLAADEPELAIRRFRILGETGPGSAHPLASPEEVRRALGASPPSAGDSGESRSSGARPPRDIEWIAERYLRSR